MALSRADRTQGRAATLRAFVAEVGGIRQQRWGNGWGYAFVAPALLAYLTFNVWPMFRGFAMAFTDYRFLIPNSEWSFNGLDNFVEMASDETFWHSFVVSLKFTAMTLPTGIVAALVAAILISRVSHRRAAAFYRWIVYLPVTMPVAVVMLMWRQMYHRDLGYLNLLLRWLGVANPPNWLGSADWVLPSIAAAELWRTFGFATLLFLIGIYGMNRELFEAAAIDGASGWQQVLSLTIPLLKPIFVLILVLSAGVASATEQMLLITNPPGSPENAALTTGLYLFMQAFQFGDMRLGYAAAMSLVLGLLHIALASLVFVTMRTERD
ncbi:MAG: sugar ABC transporter permease [Chloroflexi bacterium]|nr:sugar ABC transporter permease [Chloroflexota bacterium]